MFVMHSFLAVLFVLRERWTFLSLIIKSLGRARTQRISSRAFYPFL